MNSAQDSDGKRRGRPPRSSNDISAGRDRILAAARDLFAESGYNGVSMRNIAVRAGCQVSAIYALFPNKRQLLHLLWISIFEDLADALQRDAAHEIADQRLRLLCLTYIDFWLRRPDDYRAIFLVEDKPEGQSDQYFADNPLIRQTLAIFTTVISDGQQNGDIIADDPAEILNILLCCLQGLLYNLIGVPEYGWGDPMRLSTRTIDTVLNGLKPSKA